MENEMIKILINKYTEYWGVVIQNILLILYANSILLNDNFNLIINDKLDMKSGFSLMTIIMSFLLLNGLWLMVNFKWPNPNKTKIYTNLH